MILDTDALSAIADGEPEAVRIFSEAASIEPPVIVLGEYRFGIALSRRSGEYQRWLAQLIAATHVLPVDQETTEHYAKIRADLKAGQPIPSNDLWIGAIVCQHRLPLMSQDQHFAVVDDLKRVGW